ncbi:MAG: hypothetical protein M0Q01_03890 [Syntrophales bacterium]|jgi:hypothetical protein|nr:hypothetical protein [Syntrophales bacterium]
MNAPITKRPDNKGKAKPVTSKPIATKPGADQEKAISQLKQEIRNLAKAVIDMQQKPETQAIIVEIPKALFIRLNAYLADWLFVTGNSLSLSEYVTGAVDVCLGCDEEELRPEKEKKLAELEKNKQEKIQE